MGVLVRNVHHEAYALGKAFRDRYTILKIKPGDKRFKRDEITAMIAEYCGVTPQKMVQMDRYARMMDNLAHDHGPAIREQILRGDAPELSVDTVIRMTSVSRIGRQEALQRGGFAALREAVLATRSRRRRDLKPNQPPPPTKKISPRHYDAALAFAGQLRESLKPLQGLSRRAEYYLTLLEKEIINARNINDSTSPPRQPEATQPLRVESGDPQGGVPGNRQIPTPRGPHIPA